VPAWRERRSGRRGKTAHGSARRIDMSTQTIVVEVRGLYFTASVRAEQERARPSLVMVGKTAEEAGARLRAWLAAHPEA